MALHQLSSVTIGVPDPESVVPFYTEFGLQAQGDGVFSTLEGGRQLLLVEAPTRRLIEMVVGVDDHDDLARSELALLAAGHRPDVDDQHLSVVEPHTGVRVVLRVTTRLVQASTAAGIYNGPGRTERSALRSAGGPAVRRGSASQARTRRASPRPTSPPRPRSSPISSASR